MPTPTPRDEIARAIVRWEGEEWRPVSGLEGVYEISSHGRVKRILTNAASFKEPREIKAQMTAGYRSILLRTPAGRRRFLIHRLVATAFIGPPPTREHECAHWDNDRLNNRVTNLRWATKTENQLDKHRHGTMPPQRGSLNHVARLTESDVVEMKRLRRAGLFNRQIAQRFGVCRSLVCLINSGKRWSHVNADAA